MVTCHLVACRLKATGLDLNGSGRRFKGEGLGIRGFLCVLWIGAQGSCVDTSILASWLAYACDTGNLLLIWLLQGGWPSYRGFSII